MTEPEKEIEIKILSVPFAPFEKELLAKGAVFDVEEHQTNIRLNSSLHPLDADSHMRLRIIEVEGRETVMEWTLKKRLSQDGGRVNDEYTLRVTDRDALLLLLRQLGYDQQIPAKKCRRRYLWQDFRVEFDTWDPESFPFPYIEVEAPSVERLHDFCVAFAISKEHISTASISELKEAWENHTLKL